MEGGFTPRRLVLLMGARGCCFSMMREPQNVERLLARRRENFLNRQRVPLALHCNYYFHFGCLIISICAGSRGIFFIGSEAIYCVNWVVL